MLRTFRASLKGSRLEWIDEIPEFGNQDAIKLDSTPQKTQATLGSNTLPKIFITSCAEASKHLLCTTRGSLIKHLISIGSPGDNPPEGYTQVPHRLRLEFDDIAAPDDDPEYVLPTSEDIHKVIDFVPLISQDGGNVLIHCQAGISRFSAVALTVCAVAGSLAGRIYAEILRSNLNWLIPKNCLIKPPAAEATALRPDVIVLDKEELRHEPLWQQEPIICNGKTVKLVVEVVSTNWQDDYARKVEEYALLGIPEYWIADFRGLGGIPFIGKPKQPTFTVYQLVGDSYDLRRFRLGETIVSPLLPALQLKLDDVMP